METLLIRRRDSTEDVVRNRLTGIDEASGGVASPL